MPWIERSTRRKVLKPKKARIEEETFKINVKTQLFKVIEETM